MKIMIVHGLKEMSGIGAGLHTSVHFDCLQDRLDFVTWGVWPLRGKAAGQTSL